MPVRRIAGARLRIVVAAVEQHGAQPRIAGGVEFLDDVGQEHDVARRHAQALDDVPVAAGVALAADLGVEPRVEQRRQVAGVGMPEQQLLRRHRA
jgi:hypothetical protein